MLWKWEGHQDPGLRCWSIHPGPLNGEREATFSIGGVPLCHIPNERLMNWTELLGGKKRGSGDVFGAPESSKRRGDRKRNGEGKAWGHGEKHRGERDIKIHFKKERPVIRKTDGDDDSCQTQLTSLPLRQRCRTHPSSASYPVTSPSVMMWKNVVNSPCAERL